MPDSYGKVIELLAVNGDPDASSLHIRLLGEENTDLCWATDDDTARCLKSVMNRYTGNHKYRLSLHTTWDMIQHQHKGTVTRTFRDQSERLSFACSEQFKDELAAIQQLEQIGDILALPFLTLPKSQVEEATTASAFQGKILGTYPVMSTRKRRYSHAFKLTTAILTSIMLVLLLSNFDAAYPSKARLHQAATAKEEVTTVLFNVPRPMNLLTMNAAVPVLQDQAHNTDEVSGTDSDPDIAPPLTPHLELQDSLVYSIPKGYVALTFDDGPSKYSVDIMNVLKEHEVGATFFFIGNNVKKYPKGVAAIHAAGYPIGSHSMSHAHLPSLSYDEQVDEVKRSSRLIEAITKKEVSLFRPPYGAFNDHTGRIMDEQQQKMVLWNRDPEDWLTRDEGKILEYVRHIDPSGSIILLHESQAVVDVLPQIIADLQAQGLKIVGLR
ncbi:hypothetical protein JCM10914A_18350 [Paenibacillus sp. JCM 10914]